MVAIRLSDTRAFGEPAADVSLAWGELSLLFLGGALDEPPPGGVVSSLHAHERNCAEAMPARRARTWVGGRVALRRALTACGVPSEGVGPVLADERGAPRLPAGLRGSIAHKDAVAAALAARDGGFALGVDVEIAGALAAGLERRILTADEIASLDLQGLDEAARAIERARRFAVKEAVYKAIDPFLGRWVGFLEVSLRGEAGGYEVQGPDRAGEPRLAIEALALDLGDVVVAVARARPA